MNIRKFNQETDSENCVILLPAERRWYQRLLDVILDRYPIDKYIIVDEEGK